MASIEMKNLRSFPMETLCFDLKLEALEQMEPRDVYELAKVNQGFQGILVRDPSIVFGEHVSEIRFDDGIWIAKFSRSNIMELNVDRLFSHFSFVKRVRSCDELVFLIDHKFNGKITSLLNNLKSVNQLELRENSKEALERFLSNFHASIKKEATVIIDSSAFNDQVIKDRIENFMVGPQLKDCEEIWFCCLTEDSVRFFYNALSKTEIKNVVMRIYSGDCMDLMIQQIITNGIPSKNPEAAISLKTNNTHFTMDLSQYPGMRRIDGENRFRLLEQANDLARNSGYSGGLREESSMFRRRFDSTKDCIYVYDKQPVTKYFLAFYVPVDGND